MRVCNYSGDQLPVLLDFIESRNSWGGGFRELGRQTFREKLGQPLTAPEDNCFLLEDGGTVCGFCLVSPELPIQRAVLEIDVDPGLAGGAHERELVRRSLRRAGELGAATAHVSLAHHPARARLLKEEGFSRVRTYWEMVWRRQELPAQAISDGFTIRAFQPGDALLLARVQNAAFAGAWGFCPNSLEQVEYRSSMVNTPRPGILFLCRGARIAGYCWTCLAPMEDSIRGLICMIGVVPAFRRRGVSRSILEAGMGLLRSLGVADIGLNVDQSNSPAIRLYRSVGFEKAKEYHWLERGVSSRDVKTMC